MTYISRITCVVETKITHLLSNTLQGMRSNTSRLWLKGNYLLPYSSNDFQQADNPATPPSGYSRGLFGERGVSVTSCVLAFLWAGASAFRTLVC
jgi:hypothetical protein